ncbi:hypothetical protein LY28_02808 [Ruminiclostridium sufflavum DSM 19573]|uniref:Uncharacterized protein n=1 Tax=Ruminiclostridium sufflavum DSM 19573 TaxID=1121337 RepID=A0A318XLC1_9FIRM|nr:hypothetical protein [Ruminiclostridium sufflavum]PYG86782.1 hypothetical protein LY28_02808 [Ruminiclostridium sufflavum DSM 19573]
MNTTSVNVTATEENEILSTFHQNHFKIKEDAGFERCVDFIAKMIEKYSCELT